jgi:hypothetical protein
VQYYPFLRGKQYELICLRENAELIARAEFTPIIEPVMEGVSGVLRAVEALKGANAQFFIVANPRVGHHAIALNPDFLHAIQEALLNYADGGWIFQLQEQSDLGDLERWLEDAPGSAVFHQGFATPREVVELLDRHGGVQRTHVFGANCSTRYRAAFQADEKVLLLDGFKKRKNSEYPDVELFSELPVTYPELGVTGFGDYLIVGSEYSEGGGAAYAVAIHLTYADRDDDGVLYVRHFVSDTNNTPTDPAGKFHEAVGKLVAYCRLPESKIPRTRAVAEFEKLFESGHFPGLGYVKKLSMQHHLEVLGA